jgi:hypothetical protein
MKIEIHIYHHYDEDILSCDLAINNGTGEISYHDWNVKESGQCYSCKGTTVREKLVKK